LPEYVDRHAASRIPVSTYPEPFGLQKFDQALCDEDRAVLLKDAMVPEASHKELSRLALNDPSVRNVVNDEMRKIGLARHRTDRGEFRDSESDEIGGFGVRVAHAFQFGVPGAPG
jgi:hypothetical protein